MTPRVTAGDARGARLPAALGAIGTLLWHAVFIPAAIFGMRAPSFTTYPYTTAGTDVDSPLLLLPAITASAGVRQLKESTGRKWVPAKLAAPLADLDPLPALSMDSRQPEAQRPATQVDRIAFVKTCRETYPDERRLNQDLSAVSLQGVHVEIASGDPQRALMALHCLQALGTLER